MLPLTDAVSIPTFPSQTASEVTRTFGARSSPKLLSKPLTPEGRVRLVNLSLLEVPVPGVPWVSLPSKKATG